MAPPVRASDTILSLLLLLATETRAPVRAPPIMAFFCNTTEVNVIVGKFLWIEIMIKMEFESFQ